jgi:hypothetical protein
MTAVVATKATPKKAALKSVTSPKGVTSAVSTIAAKDKESVERTDYTVADKMTAFSSSLADIKPTGLTPAESTQEAEHRKKLSIAVEVFIRCDLQLAAAGRKRNHARFELGEQIAGLRPFYKGERVWGAVKSKLAEGLGVTGKTVDRIIESYDSQKQITKVERVVAGRLNIRVTPDLVKELVDIQLEEGICKTEQDAYRRVEQASEQIKQEAKNMAAFDPLRETCVKALSKYLQTLAPDQRAEEVMDIAKSVAAKLESEVLEEDEAESS